MTSYVHFVSPRGLRSVHAPGLGDIRVKEAVTAGGSATTGFAQNGETIIVYNNETSAIMVAFGSAPDPTLTGSTSASTAGIAVPPGAYSLPYAANVGDKAKIATLA